MFREPAEYAGSRAGERFPVFCLPSVRRRKEQRDIAGEVEFRLFADRGQCLRAEIEQGPDHRVDRCQGLLRRVAVQVGCGEVGGNMNDRCFVSMFTTESRVELRAA